MALKPVSWRCYMRIRPRNIWSTRLAIYLIALSSVPASGETVPAPPTMLSVDGIMSSQTTTSDSGSVSNVLLNDDVEHGQCIGASDKPTTSSVYPAYFASTCSGNHRDGVMVSSRAARTGSWGYELAVTKESMPNSGYTEGIHVAKMTATAAVTVNQPVGAKLRYEAWFYIESGFNDDAWHVQMQWKGQTSDFTGADRYWTGQNPKVALGFRRQNGVRQVEVTVRDAFGGQCTEFAYDRFTRPSTLGLPAIPIPDRQWVKITLEMYFHPYDGSIRVFQSIDQATAETLIVEIDRINTVSQLVSSDIAKTADLPCVLPGSRNYYYTQPTNFNLELANYLGGLSFQFSGDPHVLYIDDIKITRLD